MEIPFIGRKHELKLLADLQRKGAASLVVVYGRRRIGKSRLIQEFGRNQKFYVFEGLYPVKGTTTSDQLSEFYQRFQHYFSTSIPEFTSWHQAFHQLAQHTKKDRVVILFDEISWMGSHDPQFLGILKNAWDLAFKNNPNLLLVLCGSVSSWVEKNLLSHRGFFGRISLKLRVGPLTLPECNQFWDPYGSELSYDEKLKILCVTGGIPKYLEEIDPRLPADENIQRLCFLPSGLLFIDYETIFSSMLEHQSVYYQQIIESLCSSSLVHHDLVETMGKSGGGSITACTRDLETAGFITKDYTWHLQSGRFSRFCRYRLSDNYIRFYIKYILPHAPRIKVGKFSSVSLQALPGWNAVMGIQVENLILANRDALLHRLGIYPSDVLCDGPYFQRATAKRRGCQIDYLVQTKQGVLYVCEIKFSRLHSSTQVIDEVKEKMRRLVVPSNTSMVPVLITVGDRPPQTFNHSFFAKIISMDELFES